MLGRRKQSFNSVIDDVLVTHSQFECGWSADALCMVLASLTEGSAG